MKFLIFLFIAFLNFSLTEKATKKSLHDYTEADLERLYDEWEDNDDEKLDNDEKAEHLRKKPKLDLATMKEKSGGDPEKLMKMSKKGETLMMFVGVIDPEKPRETDIRPFTDKWTSLWQTSLYNNHIEAQVFVVDANRAIFMFKDGAQAFDAKAFLLEQKQVYEVTLEGRQFVGAGAEFREKVEL
ncbi:unnamed protein product, partial [Mesorhabditis belari]|uniref:Uncharacterized protein n=1 Tax=Mesorhabditis belari TaxID=2138241 RepID=A0AAF3EM31_9BILA